MTWRKCGMWYIASQPSKMGFVQSNPSTINHSVSDPLLLAWEIEAHSSSSSPSLGGPPILFPTEGDWDQRLVHYQQRPVLILLARRELLILLAKKELYHVLSAYFRRTRWPRSFGLLRPASRQASVEEVWRCPWSAFDCDLRPDRVPKGLY
jgi:hypothetical protein